MEKLDKVIERLEYCAETRDGFVQSCVNDAIELLKEQDEQKKQILKAVWDVLHEGVSTDTVADQDWVYEQIRNRVDKWY